MLKWGLKQLHLGTEMSVWSLISVSLRDEIGQNGRVWGLWWQLKWVNLGMEMGVGLEAEIGPEMGASGY